jgi:hypothetical protein
MRIPRTAPFLALIAVVALLAASGGAVAASMITSARIQDNTIRSRDVHDGTLKLADISSAARTALQGSTGPQGPQGPVGPAGPSGPWAIVNAAGDLVYNSGGVSASRTSNGVYLVTFDHTVAYCGTVATSIDTPMMLAVLTGPRYGGPATEVKVYVDDPSGVPANAAFTVAVHC